MENFRIDFTLSNPFPDGKKIGECGEKNAAQLIITPPENLASREEIRSYVVAFSTEKGPVRIGPFPKAETLTVPVRNALTVGTALSVQIEGFDADGEFIIKSPVLSGIMISNSIGDCDCSDGSCSDKNVIPGHMHENLDILDSLSEKNGVLCYKGSEIASENGAVTKELLSSESAFIVNAGQPYPNSMAFVVMNDKSGNPYIPEGVKIQRIELNINSEEEPVWTDIADMVAGPPHCVYSVNMNKSYYSDYFGGVVLGIVTFLENIESNIFFDAAANYNINGMRVKYVTEREETE